MKANFKYSLVAVVCLIIGGVVFYLKSNQKNDSLLDNKKETEVKLPMPSKNESVVKQTPKVKELPANPYLNKEAMSTLPKSMKQFLLLDMKSIRSDEESKEYFNLLRSSEALEDAKKILSKVEASNLAQSEREHFTATRFLTKALGDFNNKDNSALNTEVKKIILSDNLNSNNSEKVKYVFAGDKAELAQVMMAFNQNSYKELLADAKDLKIKKIIENAHKYSAEMRVK
jgi:hypothetical protein